MDDEECEFRDLVCQALESKGVLSKIRAQLRAGVFLALEDEEKLGASQSSKHKELREFLNSPHGRTAFGLVKDLLDYFGLEQTMAVLTQEARLQECGQFQVTGGARPLLLEYLTGGRNVNAEAANGGNK